MEIRVDGSRSDSESWIHARQVPVDQLPQLTEQEVSVADKLAIPIDEYRRARFASDLTRKYYEDRAHKLGLLIDEWLTDHKCGEHVTSVWLKTFAGKYRIDIDGSKARQLFVEEDLVDDLFEGGSDESRQRFHKVLELNLLERRTAKAS